MITKGFRAEYSRLRYAERLSSLRRPKSPSSGYSAAAAAERAVGDISDMLLVQSQDCFRDLLHGVQREAGVGAEHEGCAFVGACRFTGMET